MRLLVFCLCLFLWVLACPASTPRVVDGVAAQVNDRVVTITEVLNAMQGEQRRLVRLYAGSELSRKLRATYQKALDALVAHQLILETFEAQDRTLPDWVVEERENSIIHDVFRGDRSRLSEALARDGLTLDEWRNGIRDQIIVSSMRSAMVDQHVSVSPQAVRERYESNRSVYAEAPKVWLRMIVLKKDDQAAAKRASMEAVAARIQQGEAFDVVAREVSEGSRAEEGGDWGWIDPMTLRKDLREAVASLKPSHVSRVVELDRAFYLIKLEERQAKKVVSFEDVHSRIERELKKERADALYWAWIARLKKNAYVKTFKVKLFE